MKRCPECRRDYYDDSLLYCLDDGTALLEGPSSLSDEPLTAVFGEKANSPDAGASRHTREDATQVYTADQLGSSARLTDPAPKSSTRRLPMLIGLVSIVLAAGIVFAGYRYLRSSGSGEIKSI